MSVDVQTEPDRDAQAPGHRISRRTLVFAAAAVAAVLMIASYITGWTSLMGVQSVRVEGVQQLTPETVAEVADIGAGTAMMRVDVGAATARVSDLPQVKSVAVTRDWPRDVVITVTEREAVGTRKVDKSWELVDADGVAFAASTSRPRDVPVMEITDEGPTMTAVLQVLSQMSEDVLTRTATISAVDPEQILLTLRRGGAEVKWGSSAMTAYKSEILAILLRDVEAGWYDVSTPNAPATAPVTPVAGPTVEPTEPAGAGSTPQPTVSPTPAPTPTVAEPAPTPTAAPSAESEAELVD